MNSHIGNAKIRSNVDQLVGEALQARRARLDAATTEDESLTARAQYVADVEAIHASA
jgi:hypothetical protein